MEYTYTTIHLSMYYLYWEKPLVMRTPIFAIVSVCGKKVFLQKTFELEMCLCQFIVCIPLM